MSQSDAMRQSLARIENTFKRAKAFDDQPDVQADYVRYLCVLVTGYLEQAVVSVLLSHVDTIGSACLSRYVSETLQRPGSMRVDNVLRLVGRFDLDWKRKLEEKLTIRHRETIGTIYANRNRIAHGEDVDLTYRQVRNGFDVATKAVELIEGIVRQT